ncbi:hypothetical protein SASPL_118158 [Salvia splendens]|uniref:laccase n=1 Tax=Salvia splendens TaxID=180675 RepID=A0A8X8ZYV9_SALSN|nr:hypothetical protein SASPL_118158 [Salvia splendens]
MEAKFHNFLLLTISLLATQLPPSSSTSTIKKFHFNTLPLEACVKGEREVSGAKPTIDVNEGDNVHVTVTNKVEMNTTIHWHGVRQLWSAWADGPAYITQCPIGAGKAYTYKFSVVDQRGTLWWHAHFSWQRASVYGAFIIHPRTPFPFSLPIYPANVPIFGEWWNEDVEIVENEMMLYGGGPQISDAYTINGLPGPLYPCSDKDIFIHTVIPGKTYLLRLINAALNDELFFAVANHTLTVVEIDGVYTKPFATTAIMIVPGQTTNVLLTADQLPGPTGIFTMAARPYLTSVFHFNNSTFPTQ